MNGEPTVAETRPPSETGTTFANYTESSSSALASIQPCGSGTWGGARNRADRVSDTLSQRQVDGLLAAAEFAMVTGRTFQRHWTVHYGKAGVADRDGARFVGRLLHLVGKQARRAGCEMTALWVRERASGKGEHVHILLHLPTDLTLRNRTRLWIEAAGGKYRPGVSMMRSIGGRLPGCPSITPAGIVSDQCRHEEMHYRVNAAAVVRYLLKHATEPGGRRLGLKRCGERGRIVGKRCGWTQNIGAKARERM